MKRKLQHLKKYQKMNAIQITNQEEFVMIQWQLLLKLVMTVNIGLVSKSALFWDLGPAWKQNPKIFRNQERNPTPPEDIDPDLFIGADDVVEEDEDNTAGDGLVDNVAVELVSRLNIGTVILIINQGPTGFNPWIPEYKIVLVSNKCLLDKLISMNQQAR